MADKILVRDGTIKCPTCDKHEPDYVEDDPINFTDVPSLVLTAANRCAKDGRDRKVGSWTLVPVDFLPNQPIWDDKAQKFQRRDIPAREVRVFRTHWEEARSKAVRGES